jgi:hypothetical protein
MGNWSLKNEACVICSTSERPHKAKGMCNRCYQREYSRSIKILRPKVEKKPLISEKELRQLYLNERLSAPVIAARKGCSRPTIVNYLKRYGIQVRGPTLPQDTFIKRCMETWGDEYDFSKTKYYGVRKPIYVICNVSGHGGFWTNADNFARGKTQCPECMDRKKLKRGSG